MEYNLLTEKEIILACEDIIKRNGRCGNTTFGNICGFDCPMNYLFDNDNDCGFDRMVEKAKILIERFGIKYNKSSKFW